MPPRKRSIEVPGAASSLADGAGALAPSATTEAVVVGDDSADTEEAELLKAVGNGPEIVPDQILNPTPAHLLPATEIDRTKIKTNTLSRDGWVIPAHMEQQAGG